jgi:5-methylcytosine-specific restriction endonuclease McrA
MNTCKYCGVKYDKNTEHVFPFGLGGEDTYANFVCTVCNNEFSGLERELYQKLLDWKEVFKA